MTLDGTAALVTGGAKRVGRAVVLELARAGCDVAIHYRRSRVEAEELAGSVGELGRKAITVGGDLSEPANWERIVSEAVAGLGRLDALINNASSFLMGRPDTLEAFEIDTWDAMLRLNLTAPVALCHHAADHLKRTGRGRVVNLLDISVDRPWPSHLAYCASKAGLAAMTKALARAMAPEVCVYGVAPGIAVFPEEYSAELRASLTDPVPAGRAGTPEEVAHLVRFLVDSADYITGETVRIDGGRHLV